MKRREPFVDERLSARMNFDPVAPFYRWIEYAVFGSLLERARFHWIPELCGAQRVLILGDGDGRFLTRFAIANQDAQIDSMDSSGRMLELAAQRLVQSAVPCLDRIRLIQDDALTTARLRGPYDLIVTNFFLDCLDDSEQRRLLEKLAPEIAGSARWMVTDFRVLERNFYKGILRLFTGIMYSFFGVTTGLKNRSLVAFEPHLADSGFAVNISRSWLSTFVFSEVWTR